MPARISSGLLAQPAQIPGLLSGMKPALQQRTAANTVGQIGPAPAGGLLAMGGGQQPPRRDWGMGLQVLGATLRDIGDPQGQNLAMVQAVNADQMAAQREAQQAQQEQQRIKIERDMLARQIGLEPGTEEWAIYQLDPERYADLVASNREAYSLGEGDRRYGPEGTVIAEGAPRTTDDMREYAYAQSQGFQGSFTDFDQMRRRAGASSTTVNIPGQPQIGAIPQGYAAIQDPATGGWSMQLIPGGPAATEAEQAEARAGSRREQQLRSADIVTDDLSRLITMVEEQPRVTTGFMGAASQLVPATPAFNANALATTIRANIGFDRLQQMREASPTGGALGPVSDFENRNLQSTSGNLELGQGGDQFLYNTKRLFNQYMDTVHGTPQQIQQMAAQGAVPPEVADQLSYRYDLTTRNDAPAQVRSDADYDALPSGTVFVDPNGVTRRKP